MGTVKLYAHGVCQKCTYGFTIPIKEYRYYLVIPSQCPNPDCEEDIDDLVMDE